MPYEITRWPSFSFHISLISIFFSTHRHSPHWVLLTVKSMLLEHSISLMPYEITQWPPFSFHIFLISIFSSTHRHSPHWKLLRIKSTMLEHNISLMRYEITRCLSFPLDLSHTHLFLYLQTLTTLELRYSVIGDEGAQHLADALRNNTVTLILSSYLSYLSAPLHTGIDQSGASWQLHESCWSSISRWCLTK
jgi:hypothetical protein